MSSPATSGRSSGEAGFTLIELLVGIAIIGILAAIAIPVFLGQGKKANDASAKTDLRNVVGLVEECKLEQSSYRDCDTAAELDDAPGMSFGVGAGDVGVAGAQEATYFAYAVSNAKRADGQNHIYVWQKRSDGTSLRWCATDDPPNHGGCKDIQW